MQSKSQNQDHICNCTDVHFAKENPERKTKGGYQQVCKNQRQTEQDFLNINQRIRKETT